MNNAPRRRPPDNSRGSDGYPVNRPYGGYPAGRTSNGVASNRQQGAPVRRPASGRPPPRYPQNGAPSNRRPAGPSRGSGRRRRKRNQRRLLFRVLAAAVVLITAAALIAQCSGSEAPAARVFAVLASETAAEPVKNLNGSDYAYELGDEVSSESVLLIDMKSGNTVCRKNPDVELFPASITKIMTAIVAIERLKDTSMLVTLNEDMFEYIERENASTAGFLAGEKVPAADLLYGTLLSSGAECSIGLARAVASTEQKFVALMNAKAAELGMKSTHYVNSTGLHDINHYSSASDTVKLVNYALKNELFRTIFTSKTYTTSPTNMRETGITLVSTTFRAFTLAGYDNSYILGGKTGYTGEAKLCLVSMAERGGREYLLVTFGAGDGTNNKAYHVFDAAGIYKEYT